MQPLERLALRVRRLRTELGLTQMELSIQADQARTWLGDLERGNATQPTLERIVALSDALDVNPSDLVRTLDPVDRARMVERIGVLARRLAEQTADGNWAERLPRVIPKGRPKRVTSKKKKGKKKEEPKGELTPEETAEEKAAKKARKEAVRRRLTEVGDRITELREGKGLSQLKLSEPVDVTPQHMGEVERAKTNVAYDTLMRIAESLDVVPSDLVYCIDDTESPHRTIQSLRLLLDDLATT